MCTQAAQTHPQSAPRRWVGRGPALRGPATGQYHMGTTPDRSANLGQNLRVLVQQRKDPRQRRGRGILAGKQEVQHRVAHLKVRCMFVCRRASLGRSLDLLVDLNRPEVKQTLGIGGCLHVSLGGLGICGQSVGHEMTRSDGMPQS